MISDVGLRKWQRTKGLRLGLTLAAVLVFVLSFAVPAHADGHGPSCSLDVTPGSGNVPLAVTASGSCTPGNGDQNSIVGMTLVWGDGSAPIVTSQSQLTATHTKPKPANFRLC